MTEKLVWFLLVDLGGAAYKGTTASKVKIPAESDVDDFRDAVKAKNARKLSHCDASDLLVYADKTVFDANTADAPTNLQPEDDIGDYGARHAKIDQFFSQFTTVDEVDSQLEFASLLPLTKRQKLYIRSSYKSIAAQVLSNADPSMVKYAVITGTPGIGKSVFIYYMMWKLIKDRKRVLLLTEEPAIYFDGSTIWNCDQLPKPGNRQFWSVDLWCLVDSVDPTTIPGFPILNCSTLLVSTPRRDCIGEFKKLVPTPDVFYMPLWTKEELTTIAPLYPSAAAVWQHRLDFLGGVPRLVMQDIKTDPQALLMSACSSCSLNDCIMLVSIYSEINSKTKIIQTLIHIHSQEPY